MRLTKYLSDGSAVVCCNRAFVDVSYVGEPNGVYFGSIIDKLAAFEDAEEQGLLVRLPCNVGDTVFLVEGHSVYKSQVDSITLRDDGLWLDGTFNHFGLVYFSGEIGRNVFLTREEAEAALKGETEDV